MPAELPERGGGGGGAGRGRERKNTPHISSICTVFGCSHTYVGLIFNVCDHPQVHSGSLLFVSIYLSTGAGVVQGERVSDGVINRSRGGPR